MDVHTVPGPACFSSCHPIKHGIIKHQLWWYQSQPFPVRITFKVVQEQWLPAGRSSVLINGKIYFFSLMLTRAPCCFCLFHHPSFWLVQPVAQPLLPPLAHGSAGEDWRANEGPFTPLILRYWILSILAFCPDLVLTHCHRKSCQALERGAQGFLPGARHIYAFILCRRGLPSSAIRQQKEKMGAVIT